MKKYLLLILFAITNLQCGADTPLSVAPDPASFGVFYGPYTGTDDTEYTGPGFIFSQLVLTWKGEGDLTIYSVQVKIPASGVLKDDYSCTGGANFINGIGTSGVISSSTNGVGTSELVCTGITALDEGATFIVRGTVTVKGTTGSASSQKVYESTGYFNLYWFPN